MEIPQVQFSDKVVGLLVCWHTRRQVPIVLSARKTVEVPKLQFINMPVVQQQVPMVVTVQKPVVIPQVRFLGKVVDMSCRIPSQIDRRHSCRDAQADLYRPDCLEGDRNSTIANLCASEVSLMECGHSGDFLLFVGVTEFSGCGQVA